MQNWIAFDRKNEYTYPKDKEDVLVVVQCADSTKYMTVLKAHRDLASSPTGVYLKLRWEPELKGVTITHWRPLPELPET